MSATEEFRAALAAPDFAHVSIRNWCGLQAFAYRHCAASPTGVEVSAGLPLAEAEQVMAVRNVHGHFGPQRGDMASVPPLDGSVS